MSPNPQSKSPPPPPPLPPHTAHHHHTPPSPPLPHSLSSTPALPTLSTNPSNPSVPSVHAVAPSTPPHSHRPRRTPLTLAHCRAVFHLPVATAARRLGVSRPTISKVMRAHGIARWPFRKLAAATRRHRRRATLPVSPSAHHSSSNPSRIPPAHIHPQLLHPHHLHPTHHSQTSSGLSSHPRRNSHLHQNTTLVSPPIVHNTVPNPRTTTRTTPVRTVAEPRENVAETHAELSGLAPSSSRACSSLARGARRKRVAAGEMRAVQKTLCLDGLQQPWPVLSPLPGDRSDRDRVMTEGDVIEKDEVPKSDFEKCDEDVQMSASGRNQTGSIMSSTTGSSTTGASRTGMKKSRSHKTTACRATSCKSASQKCAAQRAGVQRPVSQGDTSGEGELRKDLLKRGISQKGQSRNPDSQKETFPKKKMSSQKAVVGINTCSQRVNCEKSKSSGTLSPVKKKREFNIEQSEQEICVSQRQQQQFPLFEPELLGSDSFYFEENELELGFELNLTGLTGLEPESACGGSPAQDVVPLSAGQLSAPEQSGISQLLSQSDDTERARGGPSEMQSSLEGRDEEVLPLGESSGYTAFAQARASFTCGVDGGTGDNVKDELSETFLQTLLSDGMRGENGMCDDDVGIHAGSSTRAVFGDLNWITIEGIHREMKATPLQLEITPPSRVPTPEPCGAIPPWWVLRPGSSLSAEGEMGHEEQMARM